MPVGSPQREQRNERFLREIYPGIQSELEEQANQINLDGGTERVKQALRVIMNVAEAKVVGAEFIAGVPDNKYTLSNAVEGIKVPETLQENYNSFNFDNFKDSTKIPFKGRNANIADVIQEEDTVKPFEQIIEEEKPTQVAEKAVTERRERVDKGLESVRSIATETQIEETRKAVQEDSRFRRADETEIDEEVVKRLNQLEKTYIR